MIIIQLFVILIYLIITLFSITIQPINLILGIICTLVLPGYNLLKIFKPNYTIIQKLGYLTILSLAVENIFMFFSYIFLYDLSILTEDIGFIFDPILLIASFQILNLTLIVINELILLKKRKNRNIINTNTHKVQINFPNINFNGVIKKINWRSIISYIIFIFSLIFLCLSTYYSTFSDNDYFTNYQDYRSTFTFFLRVPYTFYIFLTILIISLAYIILFTKNKYLILFSISIFLYTLWILPYLQIKNFFSWDSYFLYNLYQSYLNFGIKPENDYSFTLNFFNIMLPHRYSTSIFTTILLVNATQIEVSFVLWFIYPLYYVSIPFLFYSTFKRFSNEKEDNSKNHFIFILIILAISTPQFIKFAHSPTTGVLGTYIFFILVLEFYFFTNKREFNKKQFFFIALLYFFLSLTHTEECIYFLMFVFFYSIYQILIKYNKLQINTISGIRDIKKCIYLYAFLLSVLSLIFYLSQEFFGWISDYFYMLFEGKNIVFNFVLNLYLNSKINIIPSLRGTFTISLIFIIAIVVLIILFYIIFYLIILNLNKIFFKFNEISKKIIKKIHRFTVKIISIKIFQYLILIFIYFVLIMINWLYFPFLKEKGILLIVELIISSLFFIFNTYLFIFGIKYYKIENNKQNYFLLASFASSLIFIIFFIVGDFSMGIYVLCYRFFSIFIFFNLIIIEDNYFKILMKKRQIFKITFLILFLFLGVFYSLRTLAYG